MITVLLAACAPASAQAALSWSSPPQMLTPDQGGVIATNVHVATDSAGDGITVWIQHDPVAGVDRVVEARRPAGLNFGPDSGWLSGSQYDAALPNVAVNSKGDTIVCWQQFWPDPAQPGGGSTQVLYTFRTLGYDWTPVRDASVAGANAVDCHVALDAAGNAVIAFVREPGTDAGRIQASYRPFGIDTDFVFPQTVSYADNTFPPPNAPTGVSPQVAMNAAGDAVVSYITNIQGWPSVTNPAGVPSPSINGSATNLVAAAFRPAGGTGDGKPDFLTYQELSPTSGYDPAATPFPAVDPSGNAMVLWEDQSIYNGVKMAFRPKTLGTFNQAVQISDPNVLAHSPEMAFDGAGNALAVWTQTQHLDNNNHTQTAVAYRPVGGSFGAATPISSLTQDAFAPQVGIDGQGRPAAVWTEVDSSNKDTAQASSSDSETGAWAAPSNLSPAGDLATDTAGSPQLSVSSGGQAVAMWHFGSSTAGLMAEASFGTPAGSKPPPPPPPPPPAPIPEAINPAAPFQPGKAIVLTVTVEGDATNLVWDFGAGTPKVVAGIVDGHLQLSVRLHPATRVFNVKVTAYGPGGSRSYSRKLLLPKPPTDSVSQYVRRKVELLDSPPVFAVGDASDLIGSGFGGARDARAAADTGCGKMTVYSAAQTLSGCLRPANVLNNIPAQERGFIAPLAQQLNVNPSDLPVVQDAVQTMDGYVAEGKALVNDTWPVVPDGAAQLVSYAQTSQLTSSSASLEIAGQKFGADRNGFSMNLDPKRADIPLGDLPRPPRFPSIGGFEVVGDWNVDLKKREATITASLKLPSWITTAGINVQNSVTFKATPDRLILQDVKVGPMSVNIGSLGVDDFKLTYNEAQDEWTGQGKACVLPQACLDLVPPNGEIKIKNSQLEFAGASVDFPPPGIPLFPLVNLERLGFGIGLDPTRITGNGRVSVARIVKLDGRMVMAFPSEATPFFLKPDEVGGGFPSRLYGIPFTRFTLGATAAVIVDIPDVVTLELGHGYFLYQYPSYVAIGGGIDQKLFDFLRFYGNIGGEANFSDGTINLHGDIHGCIEVGTEVCGGIVANASHGPGNIGGIGGCIELGDVHVGGGIQWNRPFDPFIWPFDGCKWSRFAVTVNTASDAAAGRVRISVRQGAPSPAVKIYGSGAAPLVRVTGPGGQLLDSTAKGIDISTNRKIRIIRYHGKLVSFTVVGIEKDTPGAYTVSALPGSVPFTKVARATDLPNARITATVTGTGVRRTLHYDILKRPGQTILFYDLAEGNTARGIGQVTGGGRGIIHFTTAPGTTPHRVVAQFSLQNLPAERLTVATFHPASLILPAPTHLRLGRRRTALTITWQPVPDATKYQIAITSPLGYQRVLITTRVRLTVQVPRWIGGTITVRAVDSTRRSRPSRIRFRALGSAPRRIGTLGHCTVGRRKIICSKKRR